MFNGRRQPSRGGTSRMTRECQVRFCERLGVKFPGPTRPKCGCRNVRVHGEYWMVSGPSPLAVLKSSMQAPANARHVSFFGFVIETGISFRPTLERCKQFSTRSSVASNESGLWTAGESDGRPDSMATFR
jgi:hypothetical protein